MPTGKLRVANPVEAQASWASVGTSPGNLAAWIERMFTVEVPDQTTALPVIISSTEPSSSEDAKKIWINTGPIPSIRIPQNEGSSSTSIYPYPPFVPFLWIRGDDLKPAYLRKLSETELTKMGLTNPPDSGYYYVILEP